MASLISYGIGYTPASSAATSLTIQPPPVYAAGDLLVMGVAAGGPSGGVSCTAPAGWTQVAATGQPLALFTKTAVAGEGPYAVTLGNTACAAGFVAAYPAATVAGSSFAASANDVVTFTPAFPTGVTGGQVVLMLGAAVASPSDVNQNSGYQNLNLPSGWATDVPVFGPVLSSNPLNVQPVAIGLAEITATTGATTVTSPQGCNFYAGFLVLNVTGTPPVTFGVTATSQPGTGTVGMALSVKLLTGADTPANILANGAKATFYAGGVSQAPQATITPNDTGSIVYGAVTENYGVTGGSAFTADSGTTFIQNVQDTVNTAIYGTLEAGPTTAGTPLTLGGSAPASAYAVAALAEIIPAAGQALTEVDVANATATNAGQYPTTAAAQTATFGYQPPGGATLVAIVSANSAFSNGLAAVTITDTAGLTWTQLAFSAYPGIAGVWVAQVPIGTFVALPAAQLTVAAPAPSLSTSSGTLTITVPQGAAGALPQAAQGMPYTFTLGATGGNGAYIWTLASGFLPTGLSLSSSAGVISGTPTGSGTSTFTVTVTDSSGNTATSGSLTIAVSVSQLNQVFIRASWTTSAPAYSYGTLTVPVNTTDHDWLFVSCSWTDSEDQGVAYVADDVHNVYRPVAFSGISGTIKTQVFCVPNARAASKVYVSTSAYVRNLEVVVAEVAGLQAGFVVDASQVYSGGASSSFTMSLTGTQPDFVWASGAFQGAVENITQAGSGATWNVLYAGVNGGSSANGVSQAASWAVTTGAASPSMTYSGASRKFSGCIVALYAEAPLPVNANPAWPVIQVQAAFGYQPDQPSAPPVWTDITSRFLGLQGHRGRSFELDTLVAADLTLTLDNFDGALNPQNGGGPYGAVTLITPVQVLATWQGRTHAVFSGQMHALPQSYDFQRGMVKLAVSDPFSKLPQVLLASAMIQDQLFDQPLSLWPLNDQQGANQASNWSGRSTQVLVPANGKYGGGSTNGGTGTNNQPSPVTGFGNSINKPAGGFPISFDGTQDTVWGNQLVPVNNVWYKGTCLTDRGDKTLPFRATGATYECWALIENVASNSDLNIRLMCLQDEKGTRGGGTFFSLQVPLGNGALSLTRGTFSNTTSVTFPTTSGPIDGKWHHYAVVIPQTSGLVSVYMDGVLLGQANLTFPRGVPTTLTFGGDLSLDPKGYLTMFTGYMYGAAVYDRAIDAERIQSHYNAGANGFDLELAGQRIQRILTWARWSAPQAIENGLSHQQIFNYLANGYATAGLSGAVGNFATQGGSAAVTQGAQADITIEDIVRTDNGLMFVAADGTLTFRQRDTQYNVQAEAGLGDMDYALNVTPQFHGSLGEWGNTTSCTVQLSSSWSYAGGQSALMTVQGTPSAANVQGSQVAAVAGQQIGFSCWVMSPQGCYAQANVAWSGGTTATSSTFWCPPQTPVFLTLAPAVAPAGTTWAKGQVAIVSNPATGTMLYFDRPRLSPAGFQVPYEPDVEITEDIQYLFNDVVLTRNLDQATYRAKDSASRSQYYPRVVSLTVFSSTQDRTAIPDAANWLLTAYSQPSLRVQRVTVKAAGNPEAWQFALGTDIGDLLTFTRNPVGAPSVSGTFIVLSVELDIKQDQAQFSYVLAPALNSILTLDNALFGLNGVSELGW